MSKYLDLDIKDIHELLCSGSIKPIDLVNEAFDRIESDELNCFISTSKEYATNRAKALEGEKPTGLSWGIPIAIKDNIVTKDFKTTAGSKMLSEFYSVYDAHVIDLINKNGMIVVGKLNMDEFAMGSSNQTSYFGPVKNPWNHSLVSGGSSGGSASCVSSRIVPFALGSDTGGSIRQPSAFCGTVGLKPTYGRVSRYGLIAFASSLDQIGPITRNVRDNALLLNILCDKDKRDLTQSVSDEDFTRFIGDGISGMKIAIPSFYVNDLVDCEIKNKFLEIVSMLESCGCSVDTIEIPYIDYAVPLYQVVALGEASSNLARFDGIKYGYSASDVNSMEDIYYKTRSEGFGDEVKRRIMVGSFMLSGDNVLEYYNKALRIRKSISLEFSKVFSKYDLVIGPTTTCLPYKIGESLDDPNKSFVDDVLTIPVNMAGLPSMSLPIGFSSSKLPIGMQIIANRFDEASIYKLASYIEDKLKLNLDPRGDIHE